MWLTRLSITRPVTMLMLVLALVVLGLQSRGRLPLDLYPDIEFPVVMVSTIYPGTGPDEMETLVTKPIEDAVSSVSGIDKISSTSTEGVSSVVVQFELGTDLDTATSDVRAKLDAVRGALPDDVEAPVVFKADVGSMPVLSLSLSSDRRTPLEVRRIADDVVKDRLSQIPGVASVSVSGGEVREIRVEADKARLEAHRLSIGQIVSALQAENLNVPSGTIDEARRSSAIRVLGEFTRPDEILDVRIPTAAGGDLKVRDVASVRDTVVKTTTYTRVNGAPSVAIEVLKQSDANTVAVVDGVRKELEALTGREYLERGGLLKSSAPAGAKSAAILPKDLQVTVAMDQSEFIKETLHDVNKSLFEGALLAVLIVFLFLHTLRGTFIVALAIPTSLISTFMIMDALGFSMNMMSMLGLSLCVGILVDDSIVVLENIHRHLKMGATPKDAAFLGRSEIGLAAITITMVDVVVFVPIAFMGGIVGQFFRQFGIVVATATLFSLFVSFTLTPMLASRWLREEAPGEEDAPEHASRGLAARFFGAWDYLYGRVDAAYRGVLAWTLDHGSAAIAMGLMTMVASIAVCMPKPETARLLGAMPALLGTVAVLAGLWWGIQRIPGWPRTLGRLAGVALSVVIVKFASGAANAGTPMVMALMLVFLLATMAAMARPRQGPDQKRRGTGAARPLFVWATVMSAVCIVVPATFRFEFMPMVDNRQISVKLDHEVGTPLEVTNATARRIEEALLDRKLYPETKTVFTKAGAFRGGDWGGAGADSDYAVVRAELVDYEKGKNRRTDEVIRDINQRFAAVPGVKVMAALAGDGMDEGATIMIDVTGAARERTAEVAGRIEKIVKGVPGTFGVELSAREGRPEVQAHVDRVRAAQYGINVAQIASALRTSLEGDTTTKYREEGEEYDIRVSLPEAQRNRTDLLPNLVVANTPQGKPVYLYEVVKMEPAGGPTKLERKQRQRSITVLSQLSEGVALGNVQRQIDAEIAKLDTSGVTVAWSGEAEHMAESNDRMMSALMLSILLVFMLMSALFESILAPLIIMLSVPQAMAGALFALTWSNKSLNIASMIGIIMLVGLVTKNAILLVDFTNTLRKEQGMSRREALLRAGPTRLQPILMTSMAMIFGMLPTALALSKGAEMRQPMAIGVIGGLMLSTFLTLLMVPVFYEIMDDLGARFARVKEAVIRAAGV